MTAAALIDADVPEPGFYKMRLRRGAVPVGVHIFYGQTRDPETQEPIERWFWQATVNNQPTPYHQVWPMCSQERVDRKEHDYLARLQSWGESHDPDGAFADPTRKVDLLSAPLPF